MNEITPGGSFGEMALLSGMRRAASVICVETAEFLRIDKDDFHQVIKIIQTAKLQLIQKPENMYSLDWKKLNSTNSFSKRFEHGLRLL